MQVFFWRYRLHLNCAHIPRTWGIQSSLCVQEPQMPMISLKIPKGCMVICMYWSPLVYRWRLFRNASCALNLISTFLFTGCCVVRSFVILLCSFCLSGMGIFVLFPLSIFDQITVHKMLGIMKWWYPWEILTGDWQYKR